MVVSVEWKIEIVKRSYELFIKKYGICLLDIIFDVFVFLVGIGDEEYIGLVVVIIEGICFIKEVLLECLMILGVSNILFGLLLVGCEVLNLVFLYYVMKVGLDYVIVNMEKLECYVSILEEEKCFVDVLLFEMTKEMLEEFINFYWVVKKKDVVV